MKLLPGVRLLAYGSSLKIEHLTQDGKTPICGKFGMFWASDPTGRKLCSLCHNRAIKRGGKPTRVQQKAAAMLARLEAARD